MGLVEVATAQPALASNAAPPATAMAALALVNQEALICGPVMPATVTSLPRSRVSREAWPFLARAPDAAIRVRGTRGIRVMVCTEKFLSSL